MTEKKHKKEHKHEDEVQEIQAEVVAETEIGGQVSVDVDALKRQLWASHQMSNDEERFKMQELEERAFRDMLITDREFWHLRMMEDDYDLELWNPRLTYYHKSPDTRYISQGNWVGKIDLMSVADVIDKFGWAMTEEQMRTLEAIYPIRSAGYITGGYQNDGTYYDGTKSHEWNINMPSLAYRQYTSAMAGSVYDGGDIVQQILSEGEDYVNNGVAYLFLHRFLHRLHADR